MIVKVDLLHNELKQVELATYAEDYIFRDLLLNVVIGKNRIEDTRFFQILKKRAFPFFRPDILGKLRRTKAQMRLQTKLTGPGH